MYFRFKAPLAGALLLLALLTFVTEFHSTAIAGSEASLNDLSVPQPELLDRSSIEEISLGGGVSISRMIEGKEVETNSRELAARDYSNYQQPFPRSLVDDPKDLPEQDLDRLETARQLGRESRAVFTVTSAAWELDQDLSDNIFDPPTLPSAIQNANLSGASTIIVDPSISTIINITTSTVNISVPIILNGERSDGSRLVIDGNGTANIGLSITGSGSIIKNLEVRNFTFAGIALQGSNHVVQGCDVHTIDGPGINFNFCNDVTIGGTEDGEANIIHDNFGTGAWGVSLILVSDDNLIIGNYIGTTDGTTVAPNDRAGINIEDSYSNRITHNLIVGSGVDYPGIYKGCCDTTFYNVIADNYIGYSPVIDDTLPNFGPGIEIQRSVGDTIRGNVISGNYTYGIRIFTRHSDIVNNVIGTNPAFTEPLGNYSRGISGGGENILIEDNVISANGGGISMSSGCTITGNRIGGWDQATANLGNYSFGISISGPDCIIGGANSYNRNFISANFGAGINIFGAFNNNAIVENNFIGLDLTGSQNLGNSSSGITVNSRVKNAIIRNNVIAGSGRSGIHSWAASSTPADSIEIVNNKIGTDATGTFDFGSAWNGIFLNNVNNSMIGGEGDNANVIVGSDSAGIKIMNGKFNKVLNNYIGTNKNLDFGLGNASFGIILEMADSNYIGDTTDALANKIGGNDSAGIALSDFAQHNRVSHNEIGVAIDTIDFIPNRGGILIRGADSNQIGGPRYEWGNDIRNNDGIGIEVQYDDNVIQANRIFEQMSTAKASTPGHGIYIDGSGNKVGGDSLAAGNIIAYNEGAGVYVYFGIYNEIRFNRIYENGGLGIDHDPPGPNVNDSLDVDEGPNRRQNYPVVDSGYVVDNQTVVYGHLHSLDSKTYDIDFYSVARCDSSDYGEGQFYEDSVSTITIVNEGPFLDTLDFVVDSLQKLTMLATDEDGNTSEFSSCWPHKKIKIVDVDSNLIANKEFKLYRIENDIPDLTEHALGAYRTDDSGWVYLGKEAIDAGESLKVEILLHEEPSPKRPTIQPIAYRIWLDNAKFKLTPDRMFFNEIDSNYCEIVKMDHTTFAYNQLVSIEWDVDQVYVDSLISAFRLISNYLYDVGDGQTRMDSIYIVDDKLAWDVCDIRIHASNLEWPRANVDGLLNGANWAHTFMPRRFFGSDDVNRNQSALESPLNPAAGNSYRALAHEFGHYGLGFYDEYEFGESERCPAISNYGYMDNMYEGPEIQRSEMSWSQQYTSIECQNTDQYHNLGASCWDFFEANNEFAYDGIIAPIYRPDERDLSGLDHFTPPNDPAHGLDYDVGDKMGFTSTVTGKTTMDEKIRVEGITGAGPALNPLPKINIVHIRKLFSRTVWQGQTSDSGEIVILGADPGDDYIVAGPGVIVASKATRASAEIQSDWYFGITTAGVNKESPLGNKITKSTDAAVLELTRLENATPIIVKGLPMPASVSLEFSVGSLFPEPPRIELTTQLGDQYEYTTTPSGNIYSTTITDGILGGGQMRIWAYDPSVDSFFFNVNYELQEFPTGFTAFEIASEGGDAEFEVAVSGDPLERAFLTSTDYVTSLAGAPIGALRASRTHSLSVYPEALPEVNSTIKLRYNQSEIDSLLAQSGRTADLQIYRWDELTSLWDAVGGYIDTVHDLIIAPLTETGTYTAFLSVDFTVFNCGDADGSGQIDITDAVYLVNYIFAAGPAPVDEFAGDIDCSGQTEITDAVYLVNFIFAGGPAPCAACP